MEGVIRFAYLESVIFGDGDVRHLSLLYPKPKMQLPQHSTLTPSMQIVHTYMATEVITSITQKLQAFKNSCLLCVIGVLLPDIF